MFTSPGNHSRLTLTQVLGKMPGYRRSDPSSRDSAAARPSRPGPRRDRRVHRRSPSAVRGGRWAALCAGLPDPVGARRCGFAEADQEFFAQLIDETVIEATPTREPTGQRENIAQLPVITAQDNVELENLTLISVSADPEVVRALAVLKEKGITGAQVDQLQRIQPTNQQVPGQTQSARRIGQERGRQFPGQAQPQPGRP